MTTKQEAAEKGSGQAPPSWETWATEQRELLAKATASQQVLLEAAVRFVAATDGQPIMRRMAGFFLLNAQLGLLPAQVGAAVGRTDRAMRTVQSLSARELLESIWGELGRHRQSKLLAEHAGPIAKYVVDHADCTQAEMVAFIRGSFDIQVDPLTLRRFFKKYGLGILRQGADESEATAEEPRPFGSGGRASGARSSSSRRRSR
jgi:hypothetical protein